jgi:hypothetical protein
VVKGGERCSRPGCNLSTSEEYFMDRLLGRCYDFNQGVLKYLVLYEGYVTSYYAVHSTASRIVCRYDLKDSTWEPAESFSNDSSKIKDFLDRWAMENPKADVKSLDPHESIFVGDAYYHAQAGVTWLGV